MKKVVNLLLKYTFLMCLFINIIGCNLCPNNNDNSNSQDELVISYSNMNGNNILVLSNILSLSFREIISDIAIHSAFAENGDFCFTRKNYQNTNSAMFMGNIFTKNQKLLEIENQIFSIINPVISPKSNAIAFSGGKQQLYLWLNNAINKTSYIDKISNNFLESSVPLFSSDGKYLCFLEREQSGLVLSVIDIQKPDEIVKKINFYGQNEIFSHQTRLSLTQDDRIFFIASDDNSYFLNLIDLKNDTVIKNEISKNVIQIITGEISWDGTKALLVSSDGIIWGASLKNNNLKLFQLTQHDNCFRYLDVRWKKNSNTFIAFRSSCENISENSRKLYIMSVEESNDGIKLADNTYFASNVVNAYWR